MTGYFKAWTETAPAVLDEAVAAMSAAERFEVAMGRLAAEALAGERVPSVSGGWIVRGKPNDPLAREQEALHAGEVAGLPRLQVLAEVGAVLLERLPPEHAQAWLDRHRDEVRLDDRLEAKARAECASQAWVAGVLPEMAAIQWAARIAEPGRRASLCRGAFRSLCARDPGAAAAWLGKPDVPEDLRETLRAILEESQ
jgi:hypothetical protein